MTGNNSGMTGNNASIHAVPDSGNRCLSSSETGQCRLVPHHIAPHYYPEKYIPDAKDFAVPDATGNPGQDATGNHNPDPGPAREFNLSEAVAAAEANGEPALIAVMQMAKVTAEIVELVKGYNARLNSAEVAFADTLKGYNARLMYLEVMVNGLSERVMAMC